VPIATETGKPSLLVTLVEGATVAGKTHATVRAWDQATMRPVNACVEVDGIWYQLLDGHAVITSPRTDLAGLTIRGEYPGMIPWAN
jgi:hypothetical protein